MDIERYTYICSLIIDCAAYRIGGPAMHERIVTQNLPQLQRYYAELKWTPERVRRLFETNGLLDALGNARITRGAEQSHTRRARFSGRSNPSTDEASSNASVHADEIQLLIARIGEIARMIKSEKHRRRPLGSDAGPEREISNLATTLHIPP
jgi:hypothetical protein